MMKNGMTRKTENFCVDTSQFSKEFLVKLLSEAYREWNPDA